MFNFPANLFCVFMHIYAHLFHYLFYLPLLSIPFLTFFLNVSFLISSIDHFRYLFSLPLTATSPTVQSSTNPKTGNKNTISVILSPEMEKLKICREDFEAAKYSFQMVKKREKFKSKNKELSRNLINVLALFLFFTFYHLENWTEIHFFFVVVISAVEFCLYCVHVTAYGFTFALFSLILPLLFISISPTPNAHTHTQSHTLSLSPPDTHTLTTLTSSLSLSLTPHRHLKSERSELC